jgi:hypothetical protein
MKKYGIITFSIFLISLIYSFSSPPEGSLKSKKDKNEEFEYQTEIEMMYEAARKNYNSFDNFLAQYKNTILGWFGKSRELDESYIIEEHLKIGEHPDNYLIKFGTILPYILIITSIVLFFKDNQNLKIENE